MFDFTIKYQTGHSNEAADALSHCPFNHSCVFESKIDSSKVEEISNSSVCDVVDQCLNSFKIHKDLKQEAQDISFAMAHLQRE